MPDASDSDAFTEGRYRDLVAAASEALLLRAVRYFRRGAACALAPRRRLLGPSGSSPGADRGRGRRQLDYFLLFHGWFYNLLERPVLDRAREIMELGHWLGLHFDVGFYPGLSVEGLSERLRWRGGCWRS